MEPTDEFSSSKVASQEFVFLLEQRFTRRYMISDVPRIFSGIPFSAGDFGAGAQKDIILDFEE